uniref:BZIP domain-containing protein n=1 Tax=Arundo donax TaxID=35708 RepID=A0A0A9EVY0_ARUDO
MMSCVAMEPADADAVAADIICSLREADLAGWTPPWWCKMEAAAPAREGELIWPAVARGKRSRRRSPSAVSGKGRWGRASPASPLDYSGGSGSGSGASTSGGEDGGFCSPGHRRAPATKMSSIGRPQLTFQTPAPRPPGQRPRKKMRLPEVQQLERSLAVENESLREEMRALQKACNALSKENDKLETRLGQSNLQNEISSKEQKGKQQIDQRSVPQSPPDNFVLPDLNLPPQDADVPSVH